MKIKGFVGFLAFFLRLDPGFEIYVGNIKVFDFKQHGINDEVIIISYINGFFVFVYCDKWTSVRKTLLWPGF